MKIPNKVQIIYNDLLPIYELLRIEVDNILNTEAKKNEWFYRSRLKKIESFYQKLESNVNYHISNFEDFFGCEIVVDTKEQIEIALHSIQKYFFIEYQRPDNINETNLSPDSFRFSDLRLYLKKKSVTGMQEKEFQKLKFELQIKTIFSYAWAKATHDLVYKGSDISWAKERVSYQIKAMLEQSEYTISNIANTNDTFFPEHNKFKRLKSVSQIFQERWDKTLLPADLKRSTESIFLLADLLSISQDNLLEILDSKMTSDFVEKHRNISPFFAALVALQDTSLLFVSNNKNIKNKKKFLIVEELEDYLSTDFLKALVANNYVFQL